MWPVFAGRWQPFHKGHLWLAQNILQSEGCLLLAIVNPDPENPPDARFDRFFRMSNPLLYWERFLLLRAVFADLGVLDRIALVPSWHPRCRVDIEDAFFPKKRDRVWFVPLVSDEEERKAADFRALGETVKEIRDIPSEILGISAVQIREKASRQTSGWEDMLPTTLVEEVQARGWLPRLYDPYVPATSSRSAIIFFDVFLPPTIASVSAIIEYTAQKGTDVWIGIGVKVPEVGWKAWPPVSPRSIGQPFNYWERYQLWQRILKELGILERVAFTPIFTDGENFCRYEAFLPENRVWIIPKQGTNTAGMITSLSDWGEKFTLSDIAACHQYPKGLTASELCKLLAQRDTCSLGGTLFRQHVIDFFETEAMEYRAKLLVARESMTREVRTVGMIFHGPVRIEGDVVNVEGNQYNLKVADFETIQDIVVSVLLSSNDTETIAAQLIELARKIEERGKPRAEDIESGILDALDEAGQVPGVRDKLLSVANRIAQSAAGSLIATAIVAAIHKFFGA